MIKRQQEIHQNKRKRGGEEGRKEKRRKEETKSMEGSLVLSEALGLLHFQTQAVKSL